MQATFAINFFPGVTFKSKKETGDSNFNIIYFNLPNMLNIGSFQCLINKIYVWGGILYSCFIPSLQNPKCILHLQHISIWSSYISYIQ